MRGTCSGTIRSCRWLVTLAAIGGSATMALGQTKSPNADVPGPGRTHPSWKSPAALTTTNSIKMVDPAAPKPLIPPAPIHSPRGTPPNDNCAAATPIGEGTFPYDNIAATSDGPPTCGLLGSDVWFLYTASADANATFTTCSPNRTYDTAMAVYAAPCPPGVALGCNDDNGGDPACANPGVPFFGSTVTIPVTTGSSYLVQVGGFNAAQGSSDLTITLAPLNCPCPPGAIPEGEADCGLPIDTVNGGCNSTPNVFSPIAVGDTVCGTGAFDGFTRDTDWYQLNLASSTEITWSGTANFDLVLFILTSSCPPSFIGAATGTPCSPASTTACLPAGTYYLFAAPDFTNPVTCPAEYTATLTGIPCVANPPPNDDCANATAVGIGTHPYTLEFATNDYAGTCGATAAASDVWFSFTAPANGNYLVETCGLATHDSVLEIVAACGGPTLACNDDACASLQSQVRLCQAVANTTYLIRVSDFNGCGTCPGVSGMFMISEDTTMPPQCVTCPPGSIAEGEPDCGLPVDTVNGGCNYFPELFTPIAVGQTICGTGAFDGFTRDTDWFELTLASATTITWTVEAEFDVQILTIDSPCPAVIRQFALAPACSGPVSITECLQPGTYYLWVGPQFTTAFCCGNGTEYVATLTGVPANPPPNDLCANAAPAMLGTNPFDNTGCVATDGPDEGSVGDCGLFGDTSVQNDVWFSWTAPSNGTATASMCLGAAYDARMAAYLAPCPTSPNTALACNDDFCAFAGPSQVSFPVAMGNTYLIRIGGYAGAQSAGTWDLTLGAATGACCAPNGSCSVMTAADCTAAGGSYAGDNVECPAFTYSEATCNNAFEDISITGNPGCVGDDCSTLVSLGFVFNFFGTDYADITVGSNGYITFGGFGGDFSNDPIPSANDPDNLICPLWDDWMTSAALCGSGNPQLDTQTLGSAPNRRFIAQWTDVCAFGNTSQRATFQAILHETSNQVEFRYNNWALLTPSIGVENADGTVGTSIDPTSVGQVDCRTLTGGPSGPDPCALCPCDFNNDNVLNSQDYFDFLTCFFSPGSCPPGAADYNGDMVINSQDYFDFLVCFFSPPAGCP